MWLDNDALRLLRMKYRNLSTRSLRSVTEDIVPISLSKIVTLGTIPSKITSTLEVTDKGIKTWQKNLGLSDESAGEEKAWTRPYLYAMPPSVPQPITFFIQIDFENLKTFSDETCVSYYHQSLKIFLICMLYSNK